MTNIRTKGANGEREACTHLGNIINREDLARNLEQTRSGGGDILDIEGLTIEVKRQETLLLNTWWKQVSRAADNRGDIPVLMFRQNRKPWMYCIPANLLVIGAPGYITIQDAVFQVWLRHWVTPR